MSNFKVPVDWVDKIWPLLSGIRALVVMDGRPYSGHYASFGAGDLSSDPNSGDAYFGLSEFIGTLTSSTPHFTAWACNECQKCRFQTRLCPPHGLSERSNRIE